jgi:hypothetical protein
MPESILFFAWQDAEKAPEVCPLCGEQDPIFEYRITPGNRTADQGQNPHGHCCLQCGQQLLATLEGLILARWDAESAQDPKKDLE